MTLQAKALNWEKNDDYQPLSNFTQKQVNHLRLGYQEPIEHELRKFTNPTKAP